MKKRKLEIEVKCDQCGSYTSSFVVNAKHKRFCRWQTPGHPPDIDCMSDYIKDPKNNTPTIPLLNSIYKSDFYS
jgi:hypothetical protein